MTNEQIDKCLYSYVKLKKLTEYSLLKIPIERLVLTEIHKLIENRMYELCALQVKNKYIKNEQL
jgi:hypothetical protein